MTRRTLRALTAGLALALAALSPAAAAPPPPDQPPPDLQPALEQVVRDGAPGLVAIVMRDGHELYRAKAGAFDPDRPVPIASASKWMTATLLLTLVDEGKLDLDEPIGRKLPELSGDVARITLRQLLSFTSGQGSLAAMADLNQDVGIPLETGALQIAARPLEDPPGAAFKYGSGAMQLAGLLAERVSGQTWAALFEARIARPLGMTHTWWGNPLKPEAAAASVRNPNLQAGVYTTAGDYTRFLHMLAAGGAYEGGRILSAGSFEAMETAQTLKIPRVFMPPGMPATAHYAIGNWCESVAPDGQCVMASSPGAYGVYPWIDRASGLYGLFFLQYRLGPVADDIRKARDVILRHRP